MTQEHLLAINLLAKKLAGSGETRGFAGERCRDIDDGSRYRYRLPSSVVADDGDIDDGSGLHSLPIRWRAIPVRAIASESDSQ